MKLVGVIFRAYVIDWPTIEQSFGSHFATIPGRL
jgi:hypothetical protein